MSEQENSLMNSSGDEPTGQTPWELPRELKPVEARLAALAPRDDRLNRERLMFLAGQASVSRRDGPAQNRRSWRTYGGPAAVAGLTAAAATLLTLWIAAPVAHESTVGRTGEVVGHTLLPERTPHMSADRTDLSNDVLSVSDAHRLDIDQMLAAAERRLADDETAVMSAPVLETHRIVTPASWREATDQPDSSAPPAGHSSSMHTHQGIKS